MGKPVLFASFRPLNRAENIRAIYEAYNGPKEHMQTTSSEFRTSVSSGTYDLMVCDDFPAYRTPKCIMIWHGIQGGKKIGLDVPNNRYYSMDVADRITLIISASTGTVPIWSRCTGIPQDRILPLGMPRTDQYVDKVKCSGHTILARKRSYLYVPTFRDNGETPFPNINWSDLDDLLTDDELFAVKIHPWDAQYGDYTKAGPELGIAYKHIITLNATEPSAAYLYDADVVITDYSSIMFDAYLTNKPVVLYEPTPGYTDTRGMYLRYPDEYCSFLARSIPELLECVRFRASHAWLTSDEIHCADFVADMCDGHSCERLGKLIDVMR